MSSAVEGATLTGRSGAWRKRDEGRVEKLRRLSQAVDRIRGRYGDEAIRQASLVTLYRSITMKMEGFNEQHGWRKMNDATLGGD
jgi:hypothetical protein